MWILVNVWILLWEYLPILLKTFFIYFIYTEIKIILETVPEETSRNSCGDDASTLPSNLCNHDDASNDIKTLSSLDYTEDLPRFVESNSTDENDNKSLPPNFEKMANIFHVKQAPGTIDVWWLYDDGGK